MHKKRILIIISWLLVIVWMIFIFLLSDMNTFESNNKSKELINKAIDTTLDTTNNLKITDKHPSNEKRMEVASELNNPLRKIMHASVYLILAILVLNALIVSNCKLLLSIILSIIICFGYACSDEYHQKFVEGRTGQFSDVLIDSCGVIVGNIIYNGIYYIKNKKNESNNF